jgi:hypothetical protein
MWIPVYFSSRKFSLYSRKTSLPAQNLKLGDILHNRQNKVGDVVNILSCDKEVRTGDPYGRKSVTALMLATEMRLEVRNLQRLQRVE